MFVHVNKYIFRSIIYNDAHWVGSQHHLLFQIAMEILLFLSFSNLLANNIGAPKNYGAAPHKYGTDFPSNEITIN